MFLIRKEHKKWVSYLHHTAQPSTLASFRTWGIRQELVVQDLPNTKVGKRNRYTNLLLQLGAIVFHSIKIMG